MCAALVCAWVVEEVGAKQEGGAPSHTRGAGPQNSLSVLERGSLLTTESQP